MKYVPLEPITYKEALEIIKSGDDNELLLLPLRAGEFIPLWREAQDICIRLFENKSEAIRANAALGLSYVARTTGQLDKRLVTPYLLRELRDNKEYNWRIVDAIEDINLFLKWNISESGF